MQFSFSLKYIDTEQVSKPIWQVELKLIFLDNETIFEISVLHFSLTLNAIIEPFNSLNGTRIYGGVVFTFRFLLIVPSLFKVRIRFFGGVIKIISGVFN